MVLLAEESAFFQALPPPVVGGIIGAVVGLIGVFAGHKIIYERERKKGALDLFMRAIENIYGFRDELTALLNLLSQPVAFIGEEPAHYHEARKRVANAIARLKSTAFGIELMFGREGRRLL